jgi:putative transposase
MPLNLQSGLTKSMQQMLRLLQVDLFEKRDLMALPRGYPSRDGIPDENQKEFFES